MYTILIVELSSIVLLNKIILLLKVNKNVNSIVELSRNRIIVIITRILIVRIILQSTIIILIEYSYINLISTFNINR